MILPSLIRNPIIRARRAACETVGIGRYSWMGLNGLDRKLARHLNRRGGVFIEAGANDGVLQSNTYYFEKIRGWTGLLVEPVPALAARCRENRPHAIVVQAALVALDEPGATVELHVAGLMSTIAGALGDADATARHVATGLAVQGLTTTTRLRVPAHTLSAIIDAAGLRLPIDLLSLDVEGAELAALAGLDFERHAPRFICIEARTPAVIAARLEPRYRMIEVLHDAGTHQDVLYALR
jgi:FkbM family methyltransferase